MGYSFQSDSLTIATQIAYTKQELRQLNNLTYLYNPSWTPNDAEKVGSSGGTLPMALLHITKMQEIMSSQISSQQMLLYKSPNSKDTNKAQVGVVADNIVSQPKKYQIECLVPVTYSSVMNSPFAVRGADPTLVQWFGMKNKDGSWTGAFEDGTATKDSGIASTSSGLGSAFMILSGISNIATSLVKTLVAMLTTTASIINAGGGDSGGAMDYVNQVLNGTSFNKDSLEAMWHSRGILKFKTPYSWRYKTVSITDLNIDKNGTEDGCFRCTMTLQEVPIVTVGHYTPFENIKKERKMARYTLTKSIGNALVKVLDAVGSD